MTPSEGGKLKKSIKGFPSSSDETDNLVRS